MSLKEIKQYNDAQFLKDLKRVSDVLVSPYVTESYFKTTKLEVRKTASRRKINYFITDKVFVVKREVMVIY